jgi:hypothetical protein
MSHMTLWQAPAILLVYKTWNQKQILEAVIHNLIRNKRGTNVYGIPGFLPCVRRHGSYSNKWESC